MDNQPNVEEMQKQINELQQKVGIKKSSKYKLLLYAFTAIVIGISFFYAHSIISEIVADGVEFAGGTVATISSTISLLYKGAFLISIILIIIFIYQIAKKKK